MVSIPLTGDLDMRLAAARVLLQVASLAVCDDGTAELHWNHINLDLSPVEIMQALRDLDRGTPPVSALVAFDVGEQEVAGGAREIRVETRGVAVFAGKEIRLRASSCDRRSCLRAATEVAERILQGLPVHLPGSHAARAGGDLRARLIPSDEGNWIEVTL